MFQHSGFQNPCITIYALVEASPRKSRGEDLSRNASLSKHRMPQTHFRGEKSIVESESLVNNHYELF